MARQKTNTTTEVIDAEVNAVALTSASNALTQVSEQALQLQQAFDVETLDVDVLRHEVVNLINATGRALFMLGGRLCVLHTVLPKKEWGDLLENIGLSRRVAGRYMSAALKCVDADGQGRTRLLALPQSKVIELSALEEGQLDELEKTGSIGQLQLEFDEIDRMSSSELRKKIRELEQATAAKDKVIAKKSAEIDRLHVDAERTVAEDTEAATAQAQVTALRDATTAAEQALLALANAVADAADQATQPHVTTAAHTAVEYIAQALADLIQRHGIPVQFDEMVTPDWMAPAAGKTKKRA